MSDASYPGGFGRKRPAVPCSPLYGEGIYAAILSLTGRSLSDFAGSDVTD